MTLLISIGLLFFLIMVLGSGMRIVFVMALAGLIIAYIVGGYKAIIDIVGYSCWNSVNSYVLVSIPLFVLMADIITRIGVADIAYRAITSWVYVLPGRLLITNIVSCAVFASISGSSVATAVTIGNVAIPVQRAKGYKESFVCGSIAAGGTLGILIPPSIPFIIYGSMVEESVGKLFIAGIIPGIILASLFVLYIVFNSILRGDMAPPSSETYSWRDRLNSIKTLVPILFLLFMVMGSLYSGIATATEAAGMGVLGALIIAAGYRKLSFNLLKESFVQTAITSSWLLFLLVGAMILGYGLSLAGVPRAIAKIIAESGIPYLGIIILLVGMYIFLGGIMDSLAMLIITMPIVHPILIAIGADLIWFGVLMVLLMETGLLTPPVAMNLFVTQGISGVDLDVVIKGATPYIVIILLMIGIIIAFPILATWLPSHMY
jgi:C4-dicarboxylate transporter DctM subunit